MGCRSQLAGDTAVIAGKPAPAQAMARLKLPRRLPITLVSARKVVT